MSYDIHLEIDTGGPDPGQVCDVGNHTWNCSPMFVKAIGESLTDLDGRVAGEVAEQLCLGVKAMLDDPGGYEALNPPNGWGSYDSALAYLQNLALACRRHPKATIRVW